jgi:SAM-dependent methyltransferase
MATDDNHFTDAPDIDVSPVYGARYYETYTGGAYEFEGDWATFFTGLADRIVRQFNPTTVLDVGCAKGFLVHALREHGVEAHGIDVSDYAVTHAIDGARPYIRQASATEPLEGRYDLITCIETIEHVAPDQVRDAIDNLCAATDVVLLSSTSDAEHYAEPSHTTMRPPEDWAALFAEHGFLRDLDVDVSWLTPWAMLLRRDPAPTLPEVVRSYDRHVARLQRETHELRRAILALDQELAARDDDGPQHEAKEMRHELERLRSLEERSVAALAETLRLRDLLIVSERTLGQAKGEILQLRDQLHHHQSLIDENTTLLAEKEALVNSVTWRLSVKLLSPYRQFRARIGR